VNAYVFVKMYITCCQSQLKPQAGRIFKSTTFSDEILVAPLVSHYGDKWQCWRCSKHTFQSIQFCLPTTSITIRIL